MKEYSINEKITCTTNKNKCRCVAPNCNHVLLKGEGHAVFLANRGIRYVCDAHYNNNGLLGYHGNASARNNNVVGTEKKTALASQTIGVELEIKNNNGNAESFTAFRTKAEMSFLCKAESDCTVSAEFPTEKMQGLATISKFLQDAEMHDLLHYLNDENCGAHVHTYCSKVPYIRRYYHSIFVPLSNYIASLDSTERIRRFGRDINHWAQYINSNTNPTTHTNLFNMQHEHTIEFRLPRVTGHKQFMAVLRFWRAVGLLINEYDFCENADASTRKARAQALGNELVKMAQCWDRWEKTTATAWKIK